MLNAYIALGAVLGLAPACYFAAAITGVRRFRRRLDGGRRPGGPAVGPAAVTVLKPLCGDEAGLAENLRSFCDQDFPDYQVVFGVRDRRDPAAGVVEKLIAEFPGRDLAMVVNDRVVGANPKVSNLANMYVRAKHDLLVIADSDVRVGRGYLRAVAAAFSDADVGAATCLYSGRARGGLASKLGAMFINDWFFPSALIAARNGGLSFCFGATMAVRRGALDRFGGFEALADVLADDYMLGRKVHRQGRKIALVPYVVTNVVDEADLKSLFVHEVRWARTIKNVRPFAYALSTLTEGLALSALGALLLHMGDAPGWAAAAPVIVVGALRLALHLSLCGAIKEHGECAPWLIPLRDLMSLCVRIAGYFGSTVQWRGRELTVRANGRLQDVS